MYTICIYIYIYNYIYMYIVYTLKCFTLVNPIFLVFFLMPPRFCQPYQLANAEAVTEDAVFEKPPTQSF